MGERNQVAAWDFVDGLAEPLVCHACLKVARKEQIVFTNHHMDRNVGPRLEVRGLAEGDLGFPALVRGSFFGDILWHTMEEIRGEIELDAVATSVRARARTSAAVNAPIDWTTSVTSLRFPIEATTRPA
jgi:hypothetical protein